jgi:NADH pyrophosphatase NudC (nudix superfamily)
MAIDPHVGVLIASTAVAGLLMALTGVGKHGLEWRQRRRICPSCGRELRGGFCRCRS